MFKTTPYRIYSYIALTQLCGIAIRRRDFDLDYSNYVKKDFPAFRRERSRLSGRFAAYEEYSGFHENEKRLPFFTVIPFER